jgi:hypothetical protein
LIDARFYAGRREGRTPAARLGTSRGF